MGSTRCWLLTLGLALGGVAHADERDLWMFAQWAGDHHTRPFREMLVDARLYGIVLSISCCVRLRTGSCATRPPSPCRPPATGRQCARRSR